MWLERGIALGEFGVLGGWRGKTSRSSVNSVCGAGMRSARGRTKTRVLSRILAGSGVFVVRPETETWIK